MLFAALLAAASPALAQGAAVPKGEISYVCANGDMFKVRFAPADDTATFMRRGEIMDMQRQPAQTGFRFASGNTSIVGTADQIILAVPGFPPLSCQSK